MTAEAPAGRTGDNGSQVGWCGNALWPKPFQGEGEQLVCKLPAGHAGSHRNGHRNWGHVSLDLLDLTAEERLAAVLDVVGVMERHPTRGSDGLMLTEYANQLRRAAGAS